MEVQERLDGRRAAEHDDLPRARATFETGYESAGADQVQFEQFHSGSAQWCVQESEICL